MINIKNAYMTEMQLLIFCSDAKYIPRTIYVPSCTTSNSPLFCSGPNLANKDFFSSQIRSHDRITHLAEVICILYYNLDTLLFNFKIFHS